MLGVEQKGRDDYIGWYNLSVEELFRYTWAIDTDYFFTLDSALMVASKGGFDINILNRMGVRTKKLYLDSLQSVHKKMNGITDDSDSIETENTMTNDPF